MRYGICRIVLLWLGGSVEFYTRLFDLQQIGNGRVYFQKSARGGEVMIQQDNIKDFAIAAFRHYGNIDKNTFDSDSVTIALAVSSTIHHLKCEHDTIAVDGIRNVYFKLPQGNIKRGVMSSYIRRAAFDMNVSERVLWYSLQRARRVFNYYYNEFMTKTLQ